jgi:hypothetical protein
MRSLALAFVPLLAACVDPPGEGPIIGVVHGVVMRASGEPVSGATVTLRTMDRATCSNPSEFPDSTTTRVAGDFRFELTSFGGGHRPFSYPVCARLAVRFPAEAGLRDTTLSRIDYRMYFGPVDSTRVDVRLSQ